MLMPHLTKKATREAAHDQFTEQVEQQIWSTYSLATSDSGVSASALCLEIRIVGYKMAFSGRGFLGLPQNGISISCLISEPSAIHHLSRDVCGIEGISVRYEVASTEDFTNNPVSCVV